MRNLRIACLGLGLVFAAWSASPAAEADTDKIDRLIRQLRKRP